jgi:hypothetical protein
MAKPTLSASAIARNCLRLNGTVSTRRDLVRRESESPISMKSELIFARAAHCASPTDQGPHRIGRRQVEVARRNTDRLEDAIVYYPAAQDGDNVPIASGPSFPLIGCAHGLRGDRPSCPGAPTDPTGDYRQLSVLLEHLVRWGYIAISSDHSANPDVLSMSELLESSVHHMLAENRRPGSPFEQRIRAHQIVLTGHSTGGVAAVMAAVNGTLDVTALGLLAPGNAASSLIAQAETPLVIVEGTAEGPAGTGTANLLYLNARPPKHFVIVQGADHFGFTDAMCIVDGGPIATISRADQQLSAFGYLTAFLQQYVRDEMVNRAYLSGTLAIPGLDALSISVDADA